MTRETIERLHGQGRRRAAGRCTCGRTNEATLLIVVRETLTSTGTGKSRHLTSRSTTRCAECTAALYAEIESLLK